MDFFEILRITGILIGGLFVGSFVNCVIWRLHSEESFVTGRSYCPRCRHKLSPKDLVPIFSFLALGGKCRYCKTGISWQYPIVEITSAILGLIVAYIFAPGFIMIGFINSTMALVLAYYWAITAVLEIIFVSDLLWYVIPDGAVVFGAGLAVVAQIFSALSPLNSVFIAGGHTFGDVFLTGAGASFFFGALVLLSRGKWMGLGDVKYMFLMGLVLGFPEILFGLFVAFLSGAAIGVFLIGTGRKKLSSQIPFGPFLAAGTLVAILFSQAALNWYVSII